MVYLYNLQVPDGENNSPFSARTLSFPFLDGSELQASEPPPLPYLPKSTAPLHPHSEFGYIWFSESLTFHQFFTAVPSFSHSPSRCAILRFHLSGKFDSFAGQQS